MNHTLYLLFNHTLTEAQAADAYRSLGVSRIVEPPPAIRERWASVPPDLDDLADWLAPVFAWLAETARPGDHVLIQGEFGATCLAVRQAQRLGLVPVYSTTRREAHEEHMPDGTVHLRHIFAHVRFRRYGE